jgi:protein-L-isoaspartate O-methyltransferase
MSLAREVVGADGLVVAIDIDATTLAFARGNVERAGYTDVVLVRGDGGLGYPEQAPYDRICVTAACLDVPPPRFEQLGARGRLTAPVLEGTRQRLTLLEKTVDGVRRTISPTCCTCRCADGTASAAIRMTELSRRERSGASAEDGSSREASAIPGPR